MAINLQVLKDEIESNPVGMAYLPFTSENDVANSDVIDNADGANPRTVDQDAVESGDIRSETTFDGFDGLVVAKQQWFEWLTAAGDVTVNTETLQQLAGIPVFNDSIWATADRDAMNAAMVALFQFQGSRAQEIKDVLGATTASPTDVRNARLLP
jgi:hypothetical protein